MNKIKALGIPKIKALGLNNLRGVENPPQKSLKIRYLSCEDKAFFLILKFEVEARGLNPGEIKAFFNVFREDSGRWKQYSNESITSSANINPNGRTRIEIQTPLGSNINFNNYFEQNVYYQATVNVDGLSATSERFKIDLPKSGKTCFCNRDMTPEELKNIVVELRKQEVYIEKGRLVKNTNGAPILKDGKKQFVDITMYDELHEDLFKLDYQEKLNSSDANFNKFAEALNKVFKDYDINTCIRKIHFLAQCYHETQRFMATYEKNPNSNVNGGPFYRGRGLIQLTHDYNYEKLRKALKINSTLNEFAPRVAKEINLACQASGYFWRNIGAKTGNISQYADKDDVLTVSREINGYVSVPYGFNDRKLFTNILKNVMRYDQCKNKK